MGKVSFLAAGICTCSARYMDGFIQQDKPGGGIWSKGRQKPLHSFKFKLSCASIPITITAINISKL